MTVVKLVDERDQANLEFLMNATAQALAQWYEQASEDDLAYAHELLDQYAQLLDQRALSTELQHRDPDSLSYVHAAPTQLQ
jgi:hypothetical protein